MSHHDLPPTGICSSYSITIPPNHCLCFCPSWYLSVTASDYANELLPRLHDEKNRSSRKFAFDVREAGKKKLLRTQQTAKDILRASGTSVSQWLTYHFWDDLLLTRQSQGASPQELQYAQQMGLPSANRAKPRSHFIGWAFRVKSEPNYQGLTGFCFHSYTPLNLPSLPSPLFIHPSLSLSVSLTLPPPFPPFLSFPFLRISIPVSSNPLLFYLLGIWIGSVFVV